jgi:D-alanine-D-alanine ligase
VRQQEEASWRVADQVVQAPRPKGGMHVAILFNFDHDHLDDDPARVAREDVVNVAHALFEALTSQGHRAELVPLGADPFVALERLCGEPPDAAINLCESLFGDARGESMVPLFLEMRGVAYTGSGALGLSLALHKPKAKELLRARSVPTPDWAVLEDAAGAMACALPYPLIVKPSREDASSGIEPRSVVHTPRELADAVERVVSAFHQPALVERYVKGRELNVALFGNPPRALPLAEIDFSQLPAHLPPIITYAGKWDEGSVECTATPSRASELDGELAERVVAVAQQAFAALECRDYGRVDIRLGEDGVPFVIDINPNCDLSPTAGFARAAARGGMSYTDLAQELVQVARRRHGAASTSGRRAVVARPESRPVLAAGTRLRPGS